MRLVLTAEAEADLESIGDRIARDSPVRAVSFLQELRESCETLVDGPLRFALIPRHEAAGIHRRVHGNYLIFYRVRNETVEVLHILHGARDYEAILFPEA